MAPFPLGQVVATPGALKLLEEAGEDPFHYLVRHTSGDWGEVDAQDRKENELSIKHGWHVLSSYLVADKRIWIITEADGSVTTLLLSYEY